MEGPALRTEAAAIAHWNTRATPQVAPLPDAPIQTCYDCGVSMSNLEGIYVMRSYEGLTATLCENCHRVYIAMGWQPVAQQR